MTTDDTREVGPRPFLQFLQDHRQGNLHEDLTRKLHELVGAVAEQKRGGKLTLTISIDPLENATGGAVEVSDDVVLKLPKPPAPSSVFFVTAGNNLSKTDTANPKLPLRSVGEQPADLKRVGE